ncbi:unnamed protein product [Candida verbasci]|uniref:ER membrane protein complex subunit 4 n=1 Tax=Candida verbasci TaxID=1227364 RepID=A0A9W4XFC0_9ASCO|nr:unnamed protein product [Candida verbasci]
MSEDYSEILNPSIVSPPKDPSSIPSPPGYTPDFKSTNTTTTTKSKKEEAHLNTLKSKKIWEIAIGPAKSLPMNLIMSYFTGNSLQIIPVTMTLMLLWNPLKVIFNETGTIFNKLETNKNKNEIILAKFVFIICQIANMLIGIYKLYNMGLIPHSESDWLAWQEPQHYEYRLNV